MMKRRVEKKVTLADLYEISKKASDKQSREIRRLNRELEELNKKLAHARFWQVVIGLIMLMIGIFLNKLFESFG